MIRELTVTWSKKRVAERKSVRAKNSDYKTTQVTKEVRVHYQGNVRVVLDLDTICYRIAARAAANGSGKAVVLGGLIKASRVSAKEVKQEEQVFPVSDYYEVIGDAS